MEIRTEQPWKTTAERHALVAIPGCHSGTGMGLVGTCTWMTITPWWNGEWIRNLPISPPAIDFLGRSSECPEDIHVKSQKGSIWATVNILCKRKFGVRKREQPNISQQLEETVGKRLGEAA